MNAMTPIYATPAERWDALRRRDRAADGHFLYSVATTGVYCHPSCAARAARPENVAFHADRAAAERAGFRACKRCRPDLAPREAREAEMVARACRRIEGAEDGVSLDALAEEAGVSPFHFHRLFRRIAGVTPKAYAAAHRTARVHESLGGSASVTAAIYEAGFGSAGRFYEAADGMLGMTPSTWRRGGEGEAIGTAVGESSMGWVLVGRTVRGICAILIADTPEGLPQDLHARFPKALVFEDAGLEADLAVVIGYVDRPGNGIGLPLDIRGTAFQRQVWEALQAIPAGETRTYSDVARSIGQPRAVRAVASACGSNRLAVVVPCHRVIAGDGGLAGYRWGIARKRALLRREREVGD